ncbi:hypothetical protein FLL45_07220 [Aliikangiella marina]|uniref:Uncharacterized protein n=1 Tax=Aliikangiella marina TaxID=1712262 RepID=A0A545TBZ6_9GAMM|nr:hypothetical protein [Aliikangiella marina]TQV74745.1 hypothetical protein FLL45_07220 [Aliikangiella marina]
MLFKQVKAALFESCVARGKKILVLSAAVLITACASTSQKNLVESQDSTPQNAPIAYYPIFGERPEMVTPDELFKLTPEQEERFLKFYHSPYQANLYGHRRVVKFIKQYIDGFNFHSDTLIATDSLEQKRGNCLTLGILTTALTRVADIEVGYELMQAPPIYQRKGRVVTSSQHVRSILYRPSDQQKISTVFMFQPVVKLDYFPTRGARVKRRVSEYEFISMFYRNLAGDALADEELVNAYWYIVESLKYDDDNAHSTNILALVYDRMGFAEDAEKLYRYGIEKTDEKLEILSNYHKFLLRHKRYAEAKEIKYEITKIDQPNPFDWLELADREFNFGDRSQAKLYYRKVIELAPYLHDGYFGVSKIEFLEGNYSRAEKHLQKALERAFEDDTKNLYRAKLFALGSYVDGGN